MSFGYRNSLYRMKNNSDISGSSEIPVDYSKSDARNVDYTFMTNGIFNSYRNEDKYENYLSQCQEFSDDCIVSQSNLDCMVNDSAENGDFSVDTVKKILDGYCSGVLTVEEIHKMICYIIKDKNRKQLSFDAIVKSLNICNVNKGIESLSSLKNVVNCNDSMSNFDVNIGPSMFKQNNADLNYKTGYGDNSKVNISEFKGDMQPSLQGWQMMHDAAITGPGNYNRFVNGDCNINSNNMCASTIKSKNCMGHKDLLMNSARVENVLNNFSKIKGKGNQNKKGQINGSLSHSKSRYQVNNDSSNITLAENKDEKLRNANFHFDNYLEMNNRLGNNHAAYVSCMSSPDFCCSRVSYSGTASPVDSNRLCSYDGYSNTDSPGEVCDIPNLGWNNVFDFNSNINSGNTGGKSQSFFGNAYNADYSRTFGDGLTGEQGSPMARHLFNNLHLGINSIEQLDGYGHKSKQTGKMDVVPNLDESGNIFSKFDARNSGVESSKHQKHNNCNLESNMLYALLSNVARENNYDALSGGNNSKKSMRGKLKNSSSKREFRSPFELDKISDNLNLNYSSQHFYNRQNHGRNYSYSYGSPVLSDRNQSPDSAVYNKCDFASPISNDTANSWYGKVQNNEKFHLSGNLDNRKTCCPGNLEYGGPYTRCLSFLRGSVGKVRWLRTTLTYLDECDPPFRTSADGKHTLYPMMASVDDIAVEAASKTFDLSESAYWSELEDGPYTHKSVRAVTAHKVGHRPVKNQRPYVDQILTADLDRSVSLLLHSLRAMDDRLKWLPVDRVPESCPRRVFTVGIREASRGMRHRKLKVLIVAPDIEETKRDGGLDDRVNQILTQAREYNTPVIFALCRHRIGKAIGKHMRMSMLGLMTTKGSQSMFDTIMYRVNMLRQLYQCFTKFYAPPNEATLKSLVGFIPRVMSLINDELEDE